MFYSRSLVSLPLFHPMEMNIPHGLAQELFPRLGTKCGLGWAEHPQFFLSSEMTKKTPKAKVNKINKFKIK